MATPRLVVRYSIIPLACHVVIQDGVSVCVTMCRIVAVMGQ